MLFIPSGERIFVVINPDIILNQTKPEFCLSNINGVLLSEPIAVLKLKKRELIA